MITFNKLLYLLILIFFVGCSTAPTVSTQSTTNKISILTFSEDNFSATITIPKGPNSFEQTLHRLMVRDNSIVIDQYLEGIVESSIVSEMKDAIINSLPEGALEFRIKNFTSNYNSSIINLELDRKQIENTIFEILKKYNKSDAVPILPLFSIAKNPPKLKDLNNIKLLMPCADTKVPEQQLLLPNAPRAYRNGTHRGIDFYVNWGSEGTCRFQLPDSTDRHVDPRFCIEMIKVLSSAKCTPRPLVPFLSLTNMTSPISFLVGC